jgi:OFA family oxalate/formate antiporter-like MFS transporter
MIRSNRWLRLAVATLALMLAGIIYAWSFLKNPLAELYGWELRGAQLQLNYTLTLVFFCVGGLLAGLVAKKVCVKARMAVAGALLMAGFAIVSRLSGRSGFPLYLGYGVMAGTGIGLVYNTVISVTNAWFPDRKGLASGVMMLGFGFSAMVLGNLAVKLFETPLGWRGTFLLYGLAIGAGLALVGLYIRPPKEGEVPAAAVAAGGGNDYDAVSMVKRPSFWLLFVYFVIINSICTVAIGQSRELMLGIDANAAALAALGASMVSVMNGFGRLIWGALFDRLGLARTRIIDSIVLVLAPTMLLAALKTGSTGLCFAALCLTGIAYGYSPTATNTYLLAFYGRKHFNINLSIMTMTLIPAAFFSTITGGMTLTGTYTFLSVLAAAGVAVNLMIKKA